MRNDAVSDGLPPRPGGLALFRLFPASLNRYVSLDMLLIRSLVKAIITASEFGTYYITVPKHAENAKIQFSQKNSAFPSGKCDFIWGF